MTLSGLRGRTQRKDTLSALFEIHEKEKAVDLTKRGFTQRGDSSGLIRFSIIPIFTSAPNRPGTSQGRRG